MDENTSNVEPIKNRKKLSILFNVFIIFLSIIALAIAGVLIYQKRYLSPFWVNGQSMYPTLNKFALDENGRNYGVSGGQTRPGSKKVDYGVCDKHESALKKLKRFDIVLCRYYEGDKEDKIKRLVGLPGETIRFGRGEENGALYVNDVVVEQPIEKQYIASGVYPLTSITLKENEYFVLGDNRAHSKDCRGSNNLNPFAIKFEWLIGKVVAICAFCEVKTDAEGNNEAVNVEHFFPRFL